MRKHTKLTPLGKTWVAYCPSCDWDYTSKSLQSAHGEATYHTCIPVLGPRPLPPGTTVVGAGSTAIQSRDPRAHTNWWDYARLGQVW